ncbi:hypothetical protein EJ06DRAFT_535462 [Trichodelitschia bisporula]|uniref:Zn(2)-C6 fungal-type domain-containing protein n=1 Tax=Trichodelitschia bisporula TaxID=703511 RepID=A0A6G1I6Z3_9PEZI|nr:hypothetical protein EJ06DRAFT_535462 [Trichodelitschia bisporula]
MDPAHDLPLAFAPPSGPSGTSINGRDARTSIDAQEQFAPPARAPSDIDDVLRRKRKARGLKACYPCRQRKVKCSYESPCRTCSEREHPELCTYEMPAKRVNIGYQPDDLAAPPAPTSEWEQLWKKLDSLERAITDVRRDIRKIAAPGPPATDVESPASPSSSSRGGDIAQGMHTNNDLTGETVYLGGNSVPAMVMALGRGANGGASTLRELLGRSVLPVFGLDNESATYPFVDLWGLPHGSVVRIEELCKLVPSDADCLQYFKHYQDTAHVLFPGVVDVAQFESDLMAFLNNRAESPLMLTGDELAKQKVFGMSLNWLGLLFATLASGCQCSGMSRKERQLTSQVYVCCAYECLRIINYLSHSTLVDIQNLLVIGNVISNNMNAGVAWSFLGLTLRLAQSLGLHHDSPSTTPPAVKHLRDNIWARILWQDSLLSITYDRASSSTVIDHHPAAPSEGKMPYTDCMQSLCRIGLHIVRDRDRARTGGRELQRIVESHEKLQSIVDNAADHLRDVKACRSIKDQLEHWNLFLHRSYVTSELCRPSISATSTQTGQHTELLVRLRATCIESLADTVQAFLGLQNISQFASRSWAAVHRALSSALLLGLLGEPGRNDRAHALLSRLIEVMVQFMAGVDSSEISAPITRSIAALQKLNTRRMSYFAPGPDTDFRSTFDASDDAMSTPSPLTVSALVPGGESSPYSMMDSILWGQAQ